MVNPIPPSVKKIWDEWNIRGLMLFSLFLQTILILLAPLRKGTAKKLMIMLIWLVYLLADWAANFAVGLISDSQRNSPDHSTHAESSDLLAFWPPFLLLHLGGPDTITAFSLEDNVLWLRHALGLIFQVLAAVYVFLQSLPQTKLGIPTLLMFLLGIIKYLERTRSLYFASLDKFRDSMLKKPDPGPNYAKLMDDIASKKEANLPTMVIMIDEQSRNEESSPGPTGQEVGPEGTAGDPLKDDEVVHSAYHYFEIFKGLIVDLIFSFNERNESRKFFSKLSAENAFKVIEVELNFIFESLYTKAPVIHSRLGYFTRFISFYPLLWIHSRLVAAFSFFHFKVDKSRFEEFDVGITYTLFWGAVALDAVAFFILISSDWTFAALSNPEKGSNLLGEKIKSRGDAIIRWFLSFKRPRWSPCQMDGYNVLATSFLFRRWSGHISGHNLIRYCLKGRPTNVYKVKNVSGFIGCKGIHFPWLTRNKVISKYLNFIYYYKVIPLFDYVIDVLDLTDFMDEIRYLSHEPLTKQLWNFIFEELRTKSNSAEKPEVAKEISSARGNWILMKNKGYVKDLLPYLTDVTYDESLLLWHIATELFYQQDYTKEDTCKHREISKLLSDYMLYLLIMQPTMMPAETGIGKIRFRDTCAEANRLFRSKNLGPNEEKVACKEILDVNIYVEPVKVKGDRSKSVLFDASSLLKKLDDVEKGDTEAKWEIVSKIWVELLSYAACNSIARTHAQQVSKGGELITFVWLLIAHFGLGKQFQINKGQGSTKLIVGK